MKDNICIYMPKTGKVRVLFIEGCARTITFTRFLQRRDLDNQLYDKHDHYVKQWCEEANEHIRNQERRAGILPRTDEQDRSMLAK